MKRFVLITLIILIQQETQAQQESPLSFRCVGPSRGGRVTAVAGIPGRPNIFYMGATGGGMWKTADYGSSWENISDGWFASPSIGAIAISEKDPDIIFVGTGSDGIRNNIIVGKGIYKSTDGGKTWEFSGLKDGGLIGSVLIHPENHDIVYSAVIGQPFRKSLERGVYRSLNAGKTWEQILFLSDSTGAVDLEFAPGKPDIIYAAMWRGERKPWTIISGGGEDGIFKSSDGGRTWVRKTKGLPDALIGKIDFAVSLDNPARVWALIQASENMEGLYRSDDYAESWIKVEMPEEVHKSLMYRPFYFVNLTANPQNADNIWSGTKEFWTSYDGGSNWTKTPTTHVDHHDLWINPTDPLIMIEGNDGGASVTRDGGKTWSSVFNQPTAELYSCYVDDREPYYLYSGQQDNTTISIPSRQPFMNVLSSNFEHGLTEIIYWEIAGGCETGPVVPKPGNPDIVYANCKGMFSVYNRKLGEEKLYYVGAESLYGNDPSDVTYRFQRLTPIEVSPHDPDVVYYGSQYVHKTANGGIIWNTISPDLTANIEKYNVRSGEPIDEDISGEENYATLYAIRESARKAGVIWTGSNDGIFSLTEDNGKTWKNVTPDMPGGGRISNIEVSPHNAAKAYYAVYRDYLGDDSPYIYSTNNYGRSWIRLTDGKNGIPSDHPTRVVREDPFKEGLLYAGTEFGLFVSFDNGKLWHSFQRNLPITPVTDLRIIRDNLALSTMGRSFWIMDDITPLREIDHLPLSGFRLFKPRETYYDLQRILFTLPRQESADSVYLKISRNNELIYSLRKAVTGLVPDEWGIYRIDWDMRHYLPEKGGKMFRGPLVSPGSYTVMLKYGKEESIKTFLFLINPELEQSGTNVTDLIEQEMLALRVAGLLIEIRDQIAVLENSLKSEKKSAKRNELVSRLAGLKKSPGRYDQPRLLEHIEYLYDMVSYTQQKPGRDAFIRTEELENRWNGQKR